MAVIDLRLEKLKHIYTDFGEFCSRKGNVSEADTRVKVIDRILTEVLGWKEAQISREDKVSAGYIDYKMSALDKPTLILEAKKEGVYFELPRKLENSRRYKISGALNTSPEVRKAIEQAQKYCTDEGIRYAVVSNGYAWLIFKAIRDGEPWRNGEVVVFANAKEIMGNFIEFTNLLCIESVASNSLDETFSDWETKRQSFKRPITLLSSPDEQLARNVLHTQLHPFIETIFRELNRDEQLEVLEKCYVFRKTLIVTERDLKIFITDAIPDFAVSDGAVSTQPGRVS